VVDRVLNEQRSRFVIAHDLGHVCLGHELSGQEDHWDRSNLLDRKEIEAELFARALLMPRRYLQRAVELYQAKDKGHTVFSSLKEYISYVFSVAQDKATIRLEECGFATVEW